MSRENVELSRRFWTVFNGRQWNDWWSLLDPDVEWHARTDKPDVAIYRGHDALKPFVESYSFLFRLLDHKIAHVHEFHDNKEALEALGPVEQAARVSLVVSLGPS